MLSDDYFTSISIFPAPDVLVFQLSAYGWSSCSRAESSHLSSLSSLPSSNVALEAPGKVNQLHAVLLSNTFVSTSLANFSALGHSLLPVGNVVWFPRSIIRLDPIRVVALRTHHISSADNPPNPSRPYLVAYNRRSCRIHVLLTIACQSTYNTTSTLSPSLVFSIISLFTTYTHFLMGRLIFRKRTFGKQQANFLRGSSEHFGADLVGIVLFEINLDNLQLVVI